jgi:hypothetical protein
MAEPETVLLFFFISFGNQSYVKEENADDSALVPNALTLPFAVGAICILHGEK